MENDFIFMIVSNIVVTIVAIWYFIKKVNDTYSELEEMVYSFFAIFFSLIIGWAVVELAIIVGILYLVYKIPAVLITKYRKWRNLQK